jgi:hypothetical protein
MFQRARNLSLVLAVAISGAAVWFFSAADRAPLLFDDQPRDRGTRHMNVSSDGPAARAPGLALSSAAFRDGGDMPDRATCDGDNISPPLSFEHAPENVVSFALLMDDPDIPASIKAARGIEEFVHWVVYNMPPDTTGIPEGVAPPGVLGANTAGKNAYTGPCPPDREHRYFFRLFALDALLPLSSGATKAEVLSAMEGHIVASAELVGRYNRLQNR